MTGSVAGWRTRLALRAGLAPAPRALFALAAAFLPAGAAWLLRPAAFFVSVLAGFGFRAALAPDAFRGDAVPDEVFRAAARPFVEAAPLRARLLADEVCFLRLTLTVSAFL
ncbi:MAG: hypothetical protein ACE5GS_14550 [Kiloniellaceae bacterium]